MTKELERCIEERGNLRIIKSNKNNGYDLFPQANIQERRSSKWSRITTKICNKHHCLLFKEVLECPIHSMSLKRNKLTESQTYSPNQTSVRINRTAHVKLTVHSSTSGILHIHNLKIISQFHLYEIQTYDNQQLYLVHQSPLRKT